MAEDEGNKGKGPAPKAPKNVAVEKIDDKIKLITDEDIARQEEFNDLKKEELELRRTIAAANIENNVLEGEMYLRMGSMKKAAEAYERAKKRQLELSQQLELSINTGRKLEQDIAKAKQDLIDAEKAGIEKNIELAQEALDIHLDHKQAIEDNRTAVDEELQSHEKRLKALEEATEKYRNLTDAGKEAAEESEKYFQSVATGIFQITQAQDTMLGGLLTSLKKATGQGGFAGIAAGFKEVFNLTNIAASATQVVIDSFLTMFIGLDKAAAKFAAATGTGRQYMQQMEAVRKSHMNQGVSLDNVSQAFEGLLTEMIGFTALSKAQQNELAGQVAQFDRLGIKAGQASDLINTFTKIVGGSAKEAANLTQQLALMGTSIGISSQRMIKDFQKAQSVLAVYGKGSIGIFTNLSAAAKAAGVEMNTLLSIAGKFDTFESAADSVAKLNAILGSNMSATQMNRMTEDERIETIIRQIQVSGESFKQMDRFKQMAIANAAGITDMAEANKIFGMSMSQYRAYSDEMKNAKTGQEQLDKATKATQDIAEQFQNMMIQFAPQVSGMLDTFKTGMEMLTDLFAWANSGLDNFGMSLGGIVMTVGTLTLAFKIFGGLLAPIGAIMKMTGVSGKLMAASNKAVAGTSGPAAKGYRIMATGLKAMGKAGTTALPVILGIGAAALMLGGGIYIAAIGVAELVSAFAGLGPAAAYAALAVGLLIIPFVAFFAVMGLVVYSGVGPLAAGVMLAMGAAALMLGVGIAVAALGMSVLVEAIVGLGTNGLTAAASFYLIAGGMAIMMLSAAALALSLGYMVPMLIGAGVTALGAAFGIGLLGGAMMLAGLGAVAFGVGMSMVAESLMKITSSGDGAAMAMAAVGLGLLAMAGGLAAMFIFISNPLGWLAIGAAMLVMAKGIDRFATGLSEIDGEMLNNLRLVSEQFTKLAGMSAEATIVTQVTNDLDRLKGLSTEATVVLGDLSDLSTEATVIAQVTQDLEEFKSTMDNTVMAQIASLSIFREVKAMTSTRAETQVQNQLQMPEKLIVEATNTIHTQIGDTPFATSVKKAVNEAKWGPFDAGPENIVAAGNG